MEIVKQSDKLVHYSRLVELIVPGVNGGNTGTQFQFPDQQDIRYARILSIQAVSAETLTVSQPSNVPLIAAADLKKCSLVLETNDIDAPPASNQGNFGRFTTTGQTQKYLPLTLINNVQDATPNPFVRDKLFFKNMYVIWQKSFIQVSPGGLANTSDIAIGLMVYYTFFTESGQVIPRQ